MRIAFVNGSPKKNRGSASGALLKDFRSLLPKRVEVGEVMVNEPFVGAETLASLRAYDALVFAFPLYVDGIPSHLLSVLCALEEQKAEGAPFVYAIVNCGFYEGRQACLCLDMMKHWCKKAGFTWGTGLGFGGGGAMGQLRTVPLGKGPKKALGTALQVLANAVLEQKTGENLYASIGMPRIAYKLAGEFGWRQAVKKHGLSAKDLSRRIS